MMVVKQRNLLCGVDFLRENLFELAGSSLLDGLRDLAGAGGVADLAGFLVRAGVVDSVREFVLELGGSLKCDVSMSISNQEGTVDVFTFSWTLPGTEESVA
jgi:hypothetical protein